MDVYDQAEKLRLEAEAVLKLIRLADLVRPYGPITPTGSYFLDVMAYPDLDIYIPEMPLSDIFHIAEGIAEVPEVQRITFEKSHHPALPGGLYLRPRVALGDWGRPWKVDIWSIHAEVMLAKMADMIRFREKMTPQLRERILLYKHSVMNIDMRTPPLSGHYIYQAFLDQGLVEFSDVTEYLAQHGIKIY
jgi:hypothetical protein